MSRYNKDLIKTKRTQKNPKSLANLRPVKKGDRGRNPEGSRAHNPLLRAFKRAHQDTFREALEMVLDCGYDELQTMVDEGTNLKSLPHLIAKAMIKAIDHGDYGIVERLMVTLFGPAITKIDLTANTNNKNENTVYTEIAIRQALLKVKSSV
jgi:hypothetical protein